MKTYQHERVRDKEEFDSRSFRTITRGKHKLVIGCPKGEWMPRKKRCKVGTRVQHILHPNSEEEISKKFLEALAGKGTPERRIKAAMLRDSRRGERLSLGKRRAQRKKAFRNPPEEMVEIYDSVLAIEARKGEESLWPNELFRHDFKLEGAKIYGLPDGSLLIRGKKRLWKNFDYEGDEHAN